jgi:hypothetical protein
MGEMNTALHRGGRAGDRQAGDVLGRERDCDRELGALHSVGGERDRPLVRSPGRGGPAEAPEALVLAEGVAYPC